MPSATSIILSRLLARRKTLQGILDDLLSKPASYSIQGSYSQTGHTPESLRAEIRQYDAAIARLAGSPAGGLNRQNIRYTGPLE